MASVISRSRSRARLLTTDTVSDTRSSYRTRCPGVPDSRNLRIASACCCQLQAQISASARPSTSRHPGGAAYVQWETVEFAALTYFVSLGLPNRSSSGHPLIMLAMLVLGSLVKKTKEASGN